jgi:hypothetical protein
MDPNHIVVDGQCIGTAIIQTVLLLHSHIQHRDILGIAETKNSWIRAVTETLTNW